MPLCFGLETSLEVSVISIQKTIPTELTDCKSIRVRYDVSMDVEQDVCLTWD